MREKREKEKREGRGIGRRGDARLRWLRLIVFAGSVPLLSQYRIRDVR